MSWWTTVVDGAKSFGDGATWVWNKSPDSASRKLF